MVPSTGERVGASICGQGERAILLGAHAALNDGAACGWEVFQKKLALFWDSS
jgi:hypothetical protein